MHSLNKHLAKCEDCCSEFAALRRTKWLMTTLAPHTAPPELALRIKVAISQELVARQHGPWKGLGAKARWEDALNAFMLPATGGLISAILIFGLLIGTLVPAHLPCADDVPTRLYTPPEMKLTPFAVGSTNSDAVLVELVIDSRGRVQDYRVLNAPEHAESSPEMKNALLFAQFRPATSFGVPTSGRLVVSFANVNVGG